MGVRSGETGHHQPRSSEACHGLLPNQPFQCLNGMAALRIRVSPSNYLLTLPVDLVALYTICRYSNILTLPYVTLAYQAPKHGKISPQSANDVRGICRSARLRIEFTRDYLSTERLGAGSSPQGSLDLSIPSDPLPCST